MPIFHFRMQRDILDEMAAIADAMQPAMGCPQGNPGKTTVPSPRGIQDMMFDFPCTPGVPQGCGSQGFHVGHKGEVFLPQDKGVHVPYAAPETPANHPAPCSQIPQTTPPAVFVPPSMFDQREITPWSDVQQCDVQNSPDAGRTSGSMDAGVGDSAGYCVPGVLSPSSIDVGKECLGFVSVDDEGDISWGTNITMPISGDHKDGNMRGFSKLPPTAKSILERRERAIREGRRHEARLNPEERRILRRLRNRESAERCAKRKNEQAAELSRKITKLEKENASLQSVVSSYREQIAKIETLLMMTQQQR